MEIDNKEPMFYYTVEKDDEILSKDFYDEMNRNEDLKSLIVQLMNLQIKKLENHNYIEKKDVDESVIELLKKNERFICDRYFLNYYYWMTNFNLNNLMLFKYYSDKNVSFQKILRDLSTTILNNNYKIINRCGMCNIIANSEYVSCRGNKLNNIKRIQERYNSLRKASSNLNYNDSMFYCNDGLCEKCSNIIANKKEEQNILERQQKEQKENKFQELSKSFIDISSNIIITEYKDNFYIDFENKEIINNVSDGLINCVNSLFEIDNTNDIHFTDKGNKSYNLMQKMDITTISVSLFISIYTWFTTLRLDNLNDVYDHRYSNEPFDKLIIKIIDSKTYKITYDYPETRSSSMHEDYLKFRGWLFTKYKDGLDFKSVFLDNNFNENILNDTSIKETNITLSKNMQKRVDLNFISLEQAIKQTDIEYLKSMPYKQYLQSDHWKKVRGDALERADYKCQICNSEESLNVHHNTYKNRGCEKDSDVVVLCLNCHGKFHDKLPLEVETDVSNNIPIDYLQSITKSALSDKINELNKLFGFDFIADIHIDFNNIPTEIIS